MILLNVKLVRKIKQIIGWKGGGIYKRIDENRELLELLRREAPDLISKHAEIIGWLRSHDDFFCALESAVPLEDAQFYPAPNHDGRCFPRPWTD